MIQPLIHKNVTTLDELWHYAEIGIPTNISRNSYVRYTSTYEQQNSEVVENDWDYYFNEYGFRGKWRLNTDAKKIGFFGCSITFGVGVQEHQIFSNLVESFYGSDKVSAVNLGMGGSGIHRIAKLVSAAVRVIDFDAVVLTLPASTRFLISTAENQMVDVVPNFTKNEFSAVEKFVYGEYFGKPSLDMFYVDYIHWINSELKLANPKMRVLWTSWCVDTYRILEKVIDTKELLPRFHVSDRARDPHPGPLSHKHHAEHICQHLGNF